MNKKILELVRMQFWVQPQHSNLHTTRSRRLLGERQIYHPRTLHALIPDPATEFLHKSTVRVPLNWVSSKVKLRLANDTLVVGLLLGDNASTRSVCGE